MGVCEGDVDYYIDVVLAVVYYVDVVVAPCLRGDACGEGEGAVVVPLDADGGVAHTAFQCMAYTGRTDCRSVLECCLGRPAKTERKYNFNKISITITKIFYFIPLKYIPYCL